MDCEARFTSGSNDFSVWVTYGPKGGLGEHTAGLLVLKGHWDSTYERVTLTAATPTCKIATFAEGTGSSEYDDSSIGRMTTDGNYLYAAFGCHGLARYGLSGIGPGDLPTQSSTDVASSYGLFGLEVLHGAGNRAYVTYLNGPLKVFDASNLAAGPVAEFDTVVPPLI